MTANQEIGWHTDVKNQKIYWGFYAQGGQTLPTPKKNRFIFPKKSCKETTYANDYYTMNKISPFSNKFK